MILAWDNPSTSRNTCPIVTFSIINHAWSGLVLNQCLLHDRPGTKYLNHLKWVTAKVNTQMMTSWVHIHCFLAHTDIRTPFIEPKMLPCWHFFESVSIPVEHIMRSTGQTLSDNGVLPKWDFQQTYFYLAKQHKCTCRQDGPNHLNITSVLLLKYPYSRTAMRIYCTTVTNTKKKSKQPAIM